MTPQQPKPCPRCGNLSVEFKPMDDDLRRAIQEARGTALHPEPPPVEAPVKGAEGPSQAQPSTVAAPTTSAPELTILLPDEVCISCHATLTASATHGFKLRLEQEQREKNKLAMWKNRVHLVKNARTMMAQRQYSDAAVNYEKYLRVLEIVYNVDKGGLTPHSFSQSTNSKEMTIVAAVYWDLLRIYDSHPDHASRMAHVGEKLAQFLPYSTIYAEVVKQAEVFVRTAKNQVSFKAILSNTKAQRGPCFIATAAFAHEPYAVELYWLRRFRDEALRNQALGRRLIWLYYKVSPPLAQALYRMPRTSQMTRWLITKIVFLIKKSLKSAPRTGDLSL